MFLGRRTKAGKGSIVVLDAPLRDTYDNRQKKLDDALMPGLLASSWAFLHAEPDSNEIYRFAYHFNDYGVRPPLIWDDEQGVYAGEDCDGIFTNWRKMQEANAALGMTLFEGMVRKHKLSRYPIQKASPEREFPFWQKHRWSY